MPLELIAALKGISQTKLQSEILGQRDQIRTVKSISLLPPFARGFWRKKIYFILLCYLFGIKEKPAIS